MLTTIQGGTVPEITLQYRRNKGEVARRKIGSSGDAYRIFLAAWDNDTIQLQEQFKVLFLDRGAFPLAIYSHSTGSTCNVIVDVKLIISVALKVDTHKIIVAHNHPSGNLIPDAEDVLLTQKLMDAAGYFDIRLEDHLIIAMDTYLSFADKGLMLPK